MNIDVYKAPKMYHGTSIFLSENGRGGLAIDIRNVSSLLYLVQPANHRTMTGRPSQKQKGAQKVSALERTNTQVRVPTEG